MIYLDANIFVYATVFDEKIGRSCADFLRTIKQDNLSVFTSILTWDEYVYTVRKLLGKQASLELGRKFLSLQINFLGSDFSIIDYAQTISETFPLKPRDAIHLATMKKHGISTIITYDQDFSKIKDIKAITPDKFKHKSTIRNI